MAAYPIDRGGKRAALPRQPDHSLRRLPGRRRDRGRTLAVETRAACRRRGRRLDPFGHARQRIREQADILDEAVARRRHLFQPRHPSARDLGLTLGGKADQRAVGQHPRQPSVGGQDHPLAAVAARISVEQIGQGRVDLRDGARLGMRLDRAAEGGIVEQRMAVGIVEDLAYILLEHRADRTTGAIHDRQQAQFRIAAEGFDRGA